MKLPLEGIYLRLVLINNRSRHCIHWIRSGTMKLRRPSCYIKFDFRSRLCNHNWSCIMADSKFLDSFFLDSASSLNFDSPCSSYDPGHHPEQANQANRTVSGAPCRRAAYMVQSNHTNEDISHMSGLQGRPPPPSMRETNGTTFLRHVMPHHISAPYGGAQPETGCSTLPANRRPTGQTAVREEIPLVM